MTKNQKMWKQVVYRTGVWITAEIWLNLIGLDNFADYSEFIFDQDLETNLRNSRTVKITDYPPQFCSQVNDFCPIPRTAIRAKDIEDNSCNVKAAIFKNKCKQLTQPCLKIVFMISIDYSVLIN